MPDVGTEIAIFENAYAGSAWPSPFRARGGAKRLEQAFLAAKVEPQVDRKLRNVLGGLFLGQAAEEAFEEIYRERMHTEEVSVVDERKARSDADYLMKNGGGRLLYRINIKMHGSLFRRAQEVVKLDPADCFPLATYKIAGALGKHEDGLPYLFIIVTDLPISAESIGAQLPDDVVRVCVITKSVITAGKRDAEERFLALLLREDRAFFDQVRARLRHAKWFVLSAKRAEKIMKEMLFERVFALIYPRFAQNWRNAEVDMHFSFSKDMMPLPAFLDELRASSAVQVGLAIGGGKI